MEDYEQELYGIEDEFEDQFASELEVLAELEGESADSAGAARPKHPTQEGTPARVQHKCARAASLSGWPSAS